VEAGCFLERVGGVFFSGGELHRLQVRLPLSYSRPTAGQILDDIFVFYHLGLGRLSVFKLLIFTVVNNLALNNETRSPDLP